MRFLQKLTFFWDCCSNGFYNPFFGGKRKGVGKGRELASKGSASLHHHVNAHFAIAIGVL